MRTNHWGVWVDSEKPVTGVILASEPEYLFDAVFDSGIDLNWENHLKECPEEEHDYCIEEGEPYVLIGFRQCPDGKYEPDPEAEFSVIISGIYAQVVRSTWTSRAALCSPCFPGSSDLGTPGDYLTYTLPPSLWGDSGHLPLEGYEEVKA